MSYHHTVLVRTKGFIDRHTKLRLFRRRCKNPLSVQWAFLEKLLRRHEDTDFGRRYRFASIRSIRDYQERVPIHTWEGIAPYVEEVKQGNVSALFPSSEKIIMFAVTSGTTGKPKYIPVTKASYRFYRRYWDHHMSLVGRVPWTADGNFLYFPGDPEEGYFGNIPYGAITARAYAQQNVLWRSLYPYSYQVCRIKDYALRYYTIMRLAVEKRITVMGVANPSTVVTCFSVARDRAEDIIRDVRDGVLRDAEKMPEAFARPLLNKLRPNLQRANELTRIYEETGDFLPRHYWNWPLTISCFAAGPLKFYLRQLEHYHDKLYIFDAGLLASEGRLSFPVDLFKDQPGCCLTIESNFFEFIPEDEIDNIDPTILTLDQCEIGKRYFVIITNYSGLYRYHISDLVEVTGFYGRVPLITFCNKGMHCSSITGEKLTEFQVTESVRKAGEKVGYWLDDFVVCLQLDTREPSYALIKGICDGDNREILQKFIDAVETELRRMNVEYLSKRQSLRLGPMTLMIADKDSYQAYEKKNQQAASSLAQYKHSFLVGDLKCDEQFKFRDRIVSSVDLWAN